MIIYLITNLITGKQYIGQTRRTLSDRWSQHVYDAQTCRYESRLGGAIRKYGRTSFFISILDSASSQTELNQKEKDFILAYQTFNKFLGYNIAEGGYEGHIGPMPTSAVLKMAATKIGNKNCVGRILSQETRNKISVALLGRKGTKWSEDRRKKFSLSKKGIKPSLSAHQNMSLAQRKRFSSKKLSPLQNTPAV